MDQGVAFEGFRDEWLAEVKQGTPSTTELGRRFAVKLLTQWLEIDGQSEDVVYCDGAGDGGIDAACLHRGEGVDVEGEGRVEGDTWYLVQSKYGSAFAGTSTLIEEAQKVIDTLDGKRPKLSSLSQGLLERLQNFRRQASELDHIILVFATVDPLTGDQKRALEDVRNMGRARLGPAFDVEAVSVDTIYRRAQEEALAGPPRLRVPLKGALAQSGADLMVGSVSLLDLYDFLKAYRAKVGDLDELYEKNVRRFLGSRGKVNRAMHRTLKEVPERFGLFNNGITIVVTDFESCDGRIELTEPYVVNGCQTTRTIWEVCHQQLEAGGTGRDAALEDWRKRAGEGVVVTKLVKVGTSGDDLLRDITRYTNTQNAVREKDFIAITSDFRSWAKQMADTYGVFLEVQRGGWDSRRALQKQDPNARQFKEAANAFDILKVYGAGWLGEAGSAFGTNRAFLPNGPVFKRIMNYDGTEEAFGVEDLYAAYRLHRGADEYGFGRGAQPTRRQTRFLFFLVAVDLLRDVLIRNGKKTAPKDITRAFVKLFTAGNEATAKTLLDQAIEAIDEYMTTGTDDCVFAEPSFQNDYNNDLNGFLKWEQIGKTEAATPRLRSLLAAYKKTMGRKSGTVPSPREAIAAVLNAAEPEAQP